MYMSTSLGYISIATLPQNFNNSVTTWYIPMFNYVGTAYISQINAGGGLAGNGVLTNINANSVPITGTQNFGGGMVVQYNPIGGNWGLQFTGVNLANYTLVVMFVGLYNANIYFTGNNPSNGSYTTSGTAPYVAYHGNYTTLIFYADGGITFSSAATFQGNDSASGTGTGTNRYTTYMLTGTYNTIAYSNPGGQGATCVYMPQGGSTGTSLTATVSKYGNANLNTSLKIDNTTYTATFNGGAPGGPFWGIYQGGTGSANYKDPITNKDIKGGGGGSAGPGGQGISATATYTNSYIGGAANTSYYNIGTSGMNGNTGSSSNAGPGGGGSNNGVNGATGAVVVTVAGLWEPYIPNP